MSTSDVTAIVPIKPWALAKSRLAVGHEGRTALAEAFSRDVLTVLAESEWIARIVIVSAEDGLGSIAHSLGATLLRDRPLLSRDGLNVALEAGRRWASSRNPDSPVLAVPADLPALTAQALSDAIGQLASSDRSCVVDAAHTGTTLSWARRPELFRPAYGPRSARRHSDAGVRPLAGGIDPRARRDVDTLDHLAEATRIGVGPHTDVVLRELRSTSRPVSGPPGLVGAAGSTG